MMYLYISHAVCSKEPGNNWSFWVHIPLINREPGWEWDQRWGGGWGRVCPFRGVFTCLFITWLISRSEGAKVANFWHRTFLWHDDCVTHATSGHARLVMSVSSPPHHHHHPHHRHHLLCLPLNQPGGHNTKLFPSYKLWNVAAAGCPWVMRMVYIGPPSSPSRTGGLQPPG